jgi:hypothetical protein
MATGRNVSLRVADQKAFDIIPSNFDYLKMTPEDVCVLDPIQGNARGAALIAAGELGEITFADVANLVPIQHAYTRHPRTEPCMMRGVYGRING